MPDSMEVHKYSFINLTGQAVVGSVLAAGFAFAVGFTSFNFGALARYKIPCMPFYVIALFLLHYHANKDRKLAELAATE